MLTDDNLPKMRINLVSRCCCCEQYHQETMEHLFLTTLIVGKLCRYFADFSGISIEGMELSHVIMTWWYSDGPDKLKIIYKILPVVITWILWKRRNIRRHGGDLNIQGMIFQVLQITQFMIERKFHWIKLKGKDMIEILGASKHRLFIV